MKRLVFYVRPKNVKKNEKRDKKYFYLCVCFER